jgi:hypothetical protein
MDYDFSKFPRLFNELGPRDVVFRADMDDKQRADKPPFIAEDCPMLAEHLAVWDRLFKGEISEENALEEITALMEKYYGFEYPLYRGFNHYFSLVF